MAERLLYLAVIKVGVGSRGPAKELRRGRRQGRCLSPTVVCQMGSRDGSFQTWSLSSDDRCDRFRRIAGAERSGLSAPDVCPQLGRPEATDVLFQ